jgi:hypothetical protein
MTAAAVVQLLFVSALNIMRVVDSGPVSEHNHHHLRDTAIHVVGGIISILPAMLI